MSKITAIIDCFELSLMDQPTWLQVTSHGQIIKVIILAVKGFNVAETLSTLGAKLEILSFTKSQDHLRADDVECNSKC